MTQAQPLPPTLPEDEVERLLYLITHDLRAGFRALREIPDWLVEDLSPLPAPRQELLESHVGMMRVQAARCDRMLLDLRDYSRVGRMAEAPGRHTLDAVIEAAMARAPLAAGFTLHRRGDGWLEGPGNELAQLLGALLSNAQRHHDRPEGQITITAQAEPGRPGWLRIDIADDGPGIPEKFREAAFEMLRTLKSRDACEGSGMGLPIARKIATRLGGSLEALEPGPEGGALLRVILPGGGAPAIC